MSAVRLQREASQEVIKKKMTEKHMGDSQKALERAILKLAPDQDLRDMGKLSVVQLLEAKKKALQVMEVTARSSFYLV